MRPARTPALVTAAMLVAVAVAGATAAGSGAQRPATTVGIGEREYRISVYRPHVPPGTVRFNITNYGEDAHDLRVIGPTGTGAVRGSSQKIEASANATLTVRLARRGVYTLVCTLADHESRGMIARLRVVGR